MRLLGRFEEFSALGIRLGALNKWAKSSIILLDLFENLFLRADVVHFHDGRLWETRLFVCHPNGDYKYKVPLIAAEGLTVEELLEEYLRRNSVLYSCICQKETVE